MPILHSIESLEKGNIKDTQNRPIMVHASDLNFYYCKYHGHVGTAHRLFKEYLIASFVRCWNFYQPQFHLLQVLPEHILVDLTIPGRCFDVPCFALERIQEAGDLNRITEDIIVRSRKKTALKEYVLKLAFFDIWTSNEDRHTANYNILYKLIDGSFVIYPIDHEACFNHQNLERGLTLIDYESTLVYSTFFYKLFTSKELKSQEMLEKLKQTVYLCSQRCREHTKDALLEIPIGWNINVAQKEEELNRYLLNDQWFEDCWQTFLEFLQYFTNN